MATHLPSNMIMVLEPPTDYPFRPTFTNILKKFLEHLLPPLECGGLLIDLLQNAKIVVCKKGPNNEILEQLISLSAIYSCVTENVCNPELKNDWILVLDVFSKCILEAFEQLTEHGEIPFDDTRLRDLITTYTPLAESMPLQNFIYDFFAKILQPKQKNPEALLEMIKKNKTHGKLSNVMAKLLFLKIHFFNLKAEALIMADYFRRIGVNCHTDIDLNTKALEHCTASFAAEVEAMIQNHEDIFTFSNSVSSRFKGIVDDTDGMIQTIDALFLE